MAVSSQPQHPNAAAHPLTAGNENYAASFADATAVTVAAITP
jgi:hypothetical protein